MALEITTANDGKKYSLGLKGEITVATAPQLDDAISPLIDRADEVVLDLDECSYTSSAGIRVLISAYKKLHARESSLRLINVCDTIDEVLTCTNLDSLFSIERKQ